MSLRDVAETPPCSQRVAAYRKSPIRKRLQSGCRHSDLLVWYFGNMTRQALAPDRGFLEGFPVIRKVITGLELRRGINHTVEKRLQLVPFGTQSALHPIQQPLLITDAKYRQTKTYNRHQV